MASEGYSVVLKSEESKMGFSCGIIGLPNVGKSTIFNALTAANAEASNYPFCTIEPNVGIVPVPDERLRTLAKLLGKERAVPTTLEFKDIAGLVEGAHEGKGRGNQFLDDIRNTDVLAHVVRCFNDPDVVHVDGVLDPVREIDIVETELIFSDMELLERRISKLRKTAKFQERGAQEELATMEELMKSLEEGRSLRYLPLEEKHRRLATALGLLTVKPLFYVANAGEEELQGRGKLVDKLKEKAQRESTPCVVICGKLEAELTDLPPEERAEFLKEYGLESSGLDTVVVIGYKLLNLVTFYTIVGRELRAWTVKAGTPAPKAAGRIHSDMERGFVKAEVVPFDSFVKAGSMARARDQGIVRLEGRDYIIQDGDIVTFRFTS